MDLDCQLDDEEKPTCDDYSDDTCDSSDSDDSADSDDSKEYIYYDVDDLLDDSAPLHLVFKKPQGSDEEFDSRCVDPFVNLNLFRKRFKRDCSAQEYCDRPHKNRLYFDAKILDVYAVTLRRNKRVDSDNRLSLKGKLNGEIKTQDYRSLDAAEDPADICLYKVDKGDENAVYVDLSCADKYEITLFGPNANARRLPSCVRSISVDFDLKLDNQPLLEGNGYAKGVKVRTGFTQFLDIWSIYDYLDNRILERQIITEGIGRTTSPFLMYLQFAIIDPAAVALITIRILNQPGVTAVSGSIYARPCCFTYDVPLIQDKAAEVANDGTITLKRSIIAVPGHASLVVVAEKLCDQHGNSVSDGGRTFFVPMEEGPTAPQVISDALQVEVEWISHRFDH